METKKEMRWIMAEIRETMYAEMCDDLKRATTFFKKETLLNSDALEHYWLDDCVEMQYDEGLRIIALMPLIKWQLKNNHLSESCEHELSLYYEDFKKGKFKNYLSQEDYELIEKDLDWCWEHYDGEFKN